MNSKKGGISFWIVIILFFIIAGLFFMNFFSEEQPPRDSSGRDTTPPTRGRQQTQPPYQPPSDGSSSATDFVYSFNELKSGDIDKIIHCSGPLFTPAHHDAYLNEFSETKTYMARSDINIADTRFTIEQKTQKMKAVYDLYPNEIPLVSILYTIPKKDGTGVGLDKEITEGKYDHDLEVIAAMIKSFDKPVFVRLAQEFNGQWSGYHKEYFADSFKYIVDFFENEGVNNAIYMWNYMPQAQQFDYLSWYPGDDYVDWWSVDVFDLHFKQQAANTNLKKFLNDATAHGKPVIIPESGPATLNVNDANTWNTWFVPYFNLINDPKYSIKGFCYSNEDFTKTTTLSTWKDVQLQGTPIAPLYQQELLKPQYLHQKD